MKQKRKILSSLGILLLTLLFSTSGQSTTQLIIQPSRFELLLTPGKVETQAITILNNGTDTLRIGVDVRDWEMDEEGNPLFTIPGEASSSCATWLRFNPRLFQLAPGARQVVRFSLTPPAQAPAGEHRCAILFAGEPVEETALTMVSNILVTIYGYTPPVTRRGSLEEVFIDYCKDNGLQLRCKINSSGNAHLRCTGRFKVLDGNKTVLGEGFYKGNVVFPGRSRFFTSQLPLELPPGLYHVESEFSFVPPLYAGDLAEYGLEPGNTGIKHTTAFEVNAE
ncbi:MAG TPA: hypothetical protein VIL66_01525 [Bacillota bacterium]